MIEFKTRTYKDEMMDDPEIGLTELSDIFKDIGLVNQLLGGNRTIKKTLDSVLSGFKAKNISLLDVGCGDGNSLRYIARYFKKRGYKASLYGIDINHKAIQIARDASLGFPEISYFCMDALNGKEDVPICDIVVSTLTMHHLKDEQLTRFIESCQNYSSNTVIINDLERNVLAYYLFKLFGAIFIKTAAARKDGLISIRKGFIISELKSLSQTFKDWDHDIYKEWAFRFVWVSQRKRLNTQ